MSKFGDSCHRVVKICAEVSRGNAPINIEIVVLLPNRSFLRRFFVSSGAYLCSVFWDSDCSVTVTSAETCSFGFGSVYVQPLSFVSISAGKAEFPFAAVSVATAAHLFGGAYRRP